MLNNKVLWKSATTRSVAQPDGVDYESLNRNVSKPKDLRKKTPFVKDIKEPVYPNNKPVFMQNGVVLPNNLVDYETNYLAPPDTDWQGPTGEIWLQSNKKGE